MEHVQNLISVQTFYEQLKKNIPISMNKVYTLVKTPGFPSVRIGSRYYVMADKVDEWLEKQSHMKD